jgi:sugar lactone lactonase YvrE
MNSKSSAFQVEGEHLMRRHNLVGLVLSSTVTAVFLAGCSGNSQVGSPISPNVQQPQSGSVSRSIFDPNSDKAMTYVSTIGGTTVYGYRSANQANHPPVCTVGPFVSVNGGIGVDQSENLWVPDQGANPKTVTEYGPNCGPAKTVLTISGDTLPDNVAFDTNGHVYVSNAVANSGGPGNILQYTGTTVTETLTDPDMQTPLGLAVDKRNNVWVSYRDPASSGTYVAKFPRGKMPAKLFKNISLGFPGSLQFDQARNMLALAPGVPAMYIYAPPYTQNKPTRQLPLQNAPTMCTLGRSQTALYCTNGFYSKLDIYTYPAGSYLYSYNNGLSGLNPFGIAHDPPPRN